MAFVPLAQWQVHDEAGRRKYVTAAERRVFLTIADALAPDVRALCYVLAHSGCRISEALNLTHHQIDPEGCTITFRTLKRRRTTFRTVPVPEVVIAMLRALPLQRGERLWSMHRATAYRHIKEAMTLGVGIEGPMASPKGLRHGFCMAAAQQNIPGNIIGKWAGHSSPATTATYLDAVGIEEREFAARMW